MMMEEALVDSGRACGVSYALVYTPPPCTLRWMRGSGLE